MNAHRKDVERGFLARFLELTGQSVTIIDTERPDFVLVSGHERTGIEVTQVFRRGDVPGSKAAREVVPPHRALAALARLYYQAGGLPLALKTSSVISLEGTQAAALVARLVAARAGMETNEELAVYADEEHTRDPLHLRALPESFKEYSRWEYTGNAAGPVHTLDLALVEDIIVRKAKQLPHYRRTLRDVHLLIVADRLYNSGRWQVPGDFAELPKRGFDAVHLLLHPVEVHTIG